MKVLVCGGRNYNNGLVIHRELDKIHKEHGISMIIHGDAKGADQFGRGWAFANSLPYLSVPADWGKHGKSAGFKRNSKMLEYEPDLVIAFPGGKGTAMMCDIAEKAGIKVQKVEEEG